MEAIIWPPGPSLAKSLFNLVRRIQEKARWDGDLYGWKRLDAKCPPKNGSDGERCYRFGANAS
jgi:hypothetical protein